MLLVRYSEIFLKGKNRADFEKRLIENIRAALKHNNSCAKVIRKRNRIFVDDNDATYIKDVFGVASISPAKEVAPNLDSLKKEGLNFIQEFLSKKVFSTFKVSSTRLLKNIKETSIEIDCAVGEVIFETLKKKVSLKNPDVTLFIEVDETAYLFTEKIKGVGGLPLGIEGKVFALIEDEAGFFAAKLIMRRGCVVYPVFFKENNFVQKIKELSIPFEIKSFLIKDLSELDLIAKKSKVKALVVSDKIANLKKYPINLPIFYPLASIAEDQIQ